MILNASPLRFNFHWVRTFIRRYSAKVKHPALLSEMYFRVQYLIDEIYRQYPTLRPPTIAHDEHVVPRYQEGDRKSTPATSISISWSGFTHRLVIEFISYQDGYSFSSYTAGSQWEHQYTHPYYKKNYKMGGYRVMRDDEITPELVSILETLVHDFRGF